MFPIKYLLCLCLCGISIASSCQSIALCIFSENYQPSQWLFSQKNTRQWCFTFGCWEAVSSLVWKDKMKDWKQKKICRWFSKHQQCVWRKDSGAPACKQENLWVCISIPLLLNQICVCTEVTLNSCTKFYFSCVPPLSYFVGKLLSLVIVKF